MPVEVTLYTRRNCPLCDEAKAAMRASGAGVRIEEIDIDNDPELRRRYSDDVPVACIGNAELFRHRVEPAEFARLVRERRRAMPSPLADEQCIPCKGGVPSMKGPELSGMVAELGG
ncbi:MAG: glutaredoxin family protein, partial [Thermoanaerobaculia bacterium]